MKTGAATESEEEVNVSIVGGKGRQAYRATRRAASDGKKRRAFGSSARGDLTFGEYRVYICRSRKAIIRRALLNSHGSRSAALFAVGGSGTQD
jgi:hypothetical protein